MAIDLPEPNAPSWGLTVNSILEGVEAAIHQDAVENTEITSSTELVRVAKPLDVDGQIKSTTGNIWSAAKLIATTALEAASAAITGAITAATVTTTGLLTGNSLSVTTTSTLTGTVNAGGAVNVAGALDVNGATTVEALTINGTCTGCVSATIPGNPEFTGNPEFSGNITMTGDPLVSGNIHFANEVEIDGTLNHDGSSVGFYGVAPTSRGSVGSAASTQGNMSDDIGQPGAALSSVNELKDNYNALVGKYNSLRSALISTGIINS